MNYSRIICFSDLLRGTRAFPEACFDLVREPILQGSGENIGYPPEVRKKQSIWTDSGFDVNEFRRLAGVDVASEQRKAQWAAAYHQIADAAVDYLFSRLSPDMLLLTCEMPPWLSKACLDKSIDFIDVRLSPLRFGRDLYVGLRTNNNTLFHRIQAFVVSDEEIRLEASMLAANVRMHMRELEEYGRYQFASLDDCLLYIGQTPSDASLLAKDRGTLRCNDYADRISQLCSGRRLIYKEHPLASGFAQVERSLLEKITGQTPQQCLLNAYQILSAHDDVELAGISSGLLQEAPWFGKTAHVFFRPFVPLVASGGIGIANGYQQVHFQSYLSPAFWCKVMAPERATSFPIIALQPLAHHHARETFNQWWDYSKTLIWQRNLWMEGFERSGGGSLRQRIEALEQKAAQPH